MKRRLSHWLWRSPVGMLTLVSLGTMVGGTVVQLNSVAFFNATVNEGGNILSTAEIQFSVTPNGGSACTAGPGTTNNPQNTCAAVTTLTNMVAGDSKLGRAQLQNVAASNEANVDIWLTTSATTSTALDTTAASSGGLALMIFRCYSGSSTTPATVSTVADCNTAPGASNSLYLLPVYPAASGTPCTNTSSAQANDPFGTLRKTIQLAANTALGTSLVSTSTTATNTTVSLTNTSGTSVCTGGNIVSSNMAMGGPDAVTGIGVTASAQSYGLQSGHSD